MRHGSNPHGNLNSLCGQIHIEELAQFDVSLNFALSSKAMERGRIGRKRKEEKRAW
jgi:hypothetical protein